VKPWLKWILREPAICSFAITCQSMAQLELALTACDGSPMSKEDCLYLHGLNLPVQLPNYRFENGEEVLQDFEPFRPENHGSNMFKRDFVRGCPVRPG
jgi:hypothetical protein